MATQTGSVCHDVNSETRRHERQKNDKHTCVYFKSSYVLVYSDVYKNVVLRDSLFRWQFMAAVAVYVSQHQPELQRGLSTCEQSKSHFTCQYCHQFCTEKICRIQRYRTDTQHLLIIIIIIIITSGRYKQVYLHNSYVNLGTLNILKLRSAFRISDKCAE